MWCGVSDQDDGVSVQPQWTLAVHNVQETEESLACTSGKDFFGVGLLFSCILYISVLLSKTLENRIRYYIRLVLAAYR